MADELQTDEIKTGTRNNVDNPQPEGKTLTGDDLAGYGDTVKALGDGKVGGYLVRYGDPKTLDLEDDFFDAETDYGVEDQSRVPVYYQHGMDGKLKNRRIGRGIVKYDDVGLWLEAQLELRDEYERMIYQLAENGKLGWSSGAAGHLVEREPIGKASRIKAWPIAEASLTPTPAEPRNSVTPLKSFVGASLPDESETLQAGETGEDKPATGEATNQKLSKPIESKTTGETMDEQEKAQLVEEVKNAVVAALEPAQKAAPAMKKVTEMGFSGDAKAAFLHWLRTGDEAAIKGAWQGQTDNEGGYLVPDDFYAEIIEKRNELSWVRNAPVTRISTGLDKVNIPVEATAATAFVRTAEEGAYNENEPVFGQVAIEVHKFTKMIKVSEELLADKKTNLDSYMSSMFGRAMALTENSYFTTGTGSSQPQGVLTGATSSAITTAAAAALTPAELASLIGKLGSGYNTGECRWWMQNATYWYLRGLTGNAFQFAPTPNGGADALMGYRPSLTDSMPALAATNTAVLFGNPAYYAVVEREGLIIQRNPFLYQANGQVGFFAKFRIGGAVLQSEAFYYLTQHA